MKNIRGFYKRKRKIDRITKHNILQELDLNEQQSPSDCTTKVINYLVGRLILNRKPDNEYVNFCLSSFNVLGRKTYRGIARMMKLIPINTLMKTFNNLNFISGLNDRYTKLIHLKFELIHRRDKFCTLAIDEMKLKIDSDGPIGGVPCHQAKFATFFSIRGLSSNWNLPVAFYLGPNPASVTVLKSWLFEVIKRMEDCGLEVQAVVGKMRANIYDLSKHFKISPENQTFSINDKKYYFLFDPLQLMNSTRNNLMKYEIRFKNFRTGWAHIDQYFTECVKQESHSVINSSHVDPNMDELLNSDYAIELLSDQVSGHMQDFLDEGFLPIEVKGTIEFISFFSKLFRFMNSSQIRSFDQYSEAFKASKAQMNFLNECDIFLDSLQVYKHNENITKNIKFINAWKINIHALPKFYKDLKEKLKFERLVETSNYLFTKQLGIVPPGDIPTFYKMDASMFVAVFTINCMLAYIKVEISDPITISEYFVLISQKVPQRYLKQHCEGKRHEKQANICKNDANTSKV